MIAEKGETEMMTQAQFDNDPMMAAKVLSLVAANDDDAAYIEHVEQQAEAHAFETGADYA
jgi:hypothetical protein